MISIVYPDQQSDKSLKYFAALQPYSKDIEIHFIDKTQAATRAQRLNIGISKSKGNMILLHHPRSQIDPRGIEHLLRLQDQKIWGGFTHKFDQEHVILNYTSWYSNIWRPQMSSILYLDHCLFFHRSLLSQPIPDVPIFEDTLLCYELRKHAKPLVLPYYSITSAIRYQDRGILRQAMLNQILKMGFYFGVSLPAMNDWYEKQLKLN